MADQDFNIKVVTTADTTGLRQVDAGLDAIAKRQADAEAKWAKSPINPKNQTGGGGIAALGGGPVAAGGGGGAGLTGTAIGVGTIVTVLTRALNQWKEFNAEQDRWVDGMIKAQDKSRELGLSVADMLDALKSEERIDTEPLQVSFDRLTQKVRVLKTEMNIAFGAGQYEEVKRIASALGVVESQVNRVTTAMEREAAATLKARKESEKAAEKKAADEDSFIKGAIGGSSAQTKSVLANEKAAADARAAGRSNEADQFEKSAEQLEKSMTPAQREELAGLRSATTKPVGRRAGEGESQSAVDDQERNRINFERQLQGKEPLPTQGKDSGLLDAIKLAFDQSMQKYWGP